MDEKRFNTLRLLGITISYYRKARGYTQAQLAEEVNISRTHMSKYRSTECKDLCLTESSDGYRRCIGYPGKMPV